MHLMMPQWPMPARSRRRARRRRLRPEDPAGAELPGPVAVIADSVGLAMLVALEALTRRADRVRAPRHVRRAVRRHRHARPTRRASSRAGRGVACRGPEPHAEADLTRHRSIVEAFLAAARAGDFDALLDVLDPDVVFRVDRGPRLRMTVNGSAAVAEEIVPNARTFAPLARPAIVNGAAGLVVGAPERPIAICGFAFEDGRIAEIDLVLDPEKPPGRGGVTIPE
jgi:hypothetical protein